MLKTVRSWILSIIKNAQQHKKLQTNLTNTQNELNQTKSNLTNTQNELNQTKSNLTNTQNELNQTKSNLTNTQNELTSVKKMYWKNLDFHLRKITPQAFLEVVEIHLSESCNLNCFGCNHFSQLAEKEFPDLKKFEKDIFRLAEISQGYIENIRLMGGEPLLNPNCVDYFDITRKYFPNSNIWLVTNGILLDKQDECFWNSCHKNNIEIRPTKYPIKIDWARIENICKKYQVSLVFFNQGQIEKTSWKFLLDPFGNQDRYKNFINCSMANHCIQFKDGRLYTCTLPAHIHHFNKKFNSNFQVTKLDFIDIYKVKDYQEILTFLAKPISFCRYCKVSKWHSLGEWKKSELLEDEYL
nr:radical SAM protein [Campylobacter lari]MCR6536026.1 4Fe-4S cluster-binding domain-containing protein [Campylobacter lari]